eukprot:TRINITY_DN1238_c0_g4_i1.p1 TRINITY_DN1238_c0_g4~~TRINITY_DN1238_c0_g4_i1.p1  ORF type:complete len:193 (-),score=56.39 TRINITY_DN1238_c0_g4_i1:244-822(-)
MSEESLASLRRRLTALETAVFLQPSTSSPIALDGPETVHEKLQSVQSQLDQLLKTERRLAAFFESYISLASAAAASMEENSGSSSSLEAEGKKRVLLESFPQFQVAFSQFSALKQASTFLNAPEYQDVLESEGKVEDLQHLSLRQSLAVSSLNSKTESLLFAYNNIVNSISQRFEGIEKGLRVYEQLLDVKN